MTPRAIPLLICLLGAAWGVLGATPAVSKAERPAIPRIASIMGMQVGVSGQKTLERRLGKGVRSIGGHPNSHLSWRTRMPEGVLAVDGFSFAADDSYVIEDLSWTRSSSAGDLPMARLPRRSGWLGSIVPGMSEAEVRHLTARLPRPKKHGSTWEWTSLGYFRPKLAQQQPYFSKWSATLTFKRGRLEQISLSAL